MSLYYGNTKIGSLYLGSDKIKEAYYGNVKVFGSSDPYNPLGLPPFTLRCKFSQGYTPDRGYTQTLVDSTNNVWDITTESSEYAWDDLFASCTDLLEVLGINSTGVQEMYGTFNICESLERVPHTFDTSSVTTIGEMFSACSSLRELPDLPVDRVSDCSRAFGNCSNVESGALNMYNKLSQVATTYTQCFLNCGSNTTTGAAELAQIPSDWK